MPKSNYNLDPFIELIDENCWSGWDAVANRLAATIDGTAQPRIIIECYAGVHIAEICTALTNRLAPATFVETLPSVFKPEIEIDRLCAPDLGGDDPVFGRMTRLVMEDFIDPEKVSALRETLAATRGLAIVCGPGASLCTTGTVLVYADMPRWEGQLRQRRNEVPNLGTNNPTLKASLQYKRAFFIDWRVCDKLKRKGFHTWDFYLDTVVPGAPKLITGATFHHAMAAAVTQPFRFTPFFDPGPWGGQWMRETFGLPADPPNYAWCFDCVPEENSLVFRIAGHRVEMPGINLVFHQPEPLLGIPVHGRMGAEFPIRTDFLDTMGGGNLSLQVHPTIDFAREHFGLSYTQDESYYLLAAGDDAEVILGLREDADPDAMIADLEAAQTDPDRPFPDARYMARFPAKKHDHFLIPAGTCHCSGANTMVLEISHTPYIFTFKLWDWGRLGLDGNPRPVHLDYGKQVIDWRRRESWVAKHLVNAITPIAAGDGWREERTGLYPSEFLETRRHWFTGTVPHDTRQESVNVINLVEGDEVLIESPSNAFRPFVLHYAETVCIPAAIGPYTIRPHGPAVGTECATLKVTCRV